MSIQTPDLRLILAVRSAGLRADMAGTGFLPTTEPESISALIEAGLWIGPRDVLEETEEFRQVIPYIVLQYGSRFLRYTRTPAGGEARLHGRTSIGLGGHIDLCDVTTRGDEIDLPATLSTAAHREIQEELGGVDCDNKEWIGVLVDNDSAVGRVHLGLVGLWRLRALPTGLTEDAIGALACCTLDELWADQDRLEGWSALLLPALNARLAGSSPRAQAA